jgi:hypothetical protein
MGRLFDAHYHLQCQNNITINKRLVSFLSWLFSHHWRFLLLDILDESIRFYLVKLQTISNMKLWLKISQPTLAWILWLWFQVHWKNGGNGCHVNTCITYCGMSCFVGSLKFSFISQLEIAMKFVACWFIL